MSVHDQLAAGLAALGLAASQDDLQKLADYAALMAKWNKTYNLTAVREIEKMVPLHLLDSLAVLPHVGEAPLLDVGSGGGLPGIPLAIMRPQLSITLLDTNSKKSAFQKQAAIELGLRNVSVVNGRVEDFNPAEKYRQIVSRAFSELSDFVNWTRHLLAPEGVWLAMKGLRPDEEIARLPQGVVVSGIHRLTVPDVDGERHLIVLREG